MQKGARLGAYEILAKLGEGGMGEVYRARDTRLDRVVAIKVIASSAVDAPDLRERFDREARAVAALNHPHICTLHDVGHDNGVAFLVMEHLEGETLAERLARGALPIGDVTRYGLEIADALDKAHRAGIVHRDLKPANIFLTKQGSKLLDFGLAKHAAASPAGATMLPTTPAHLTAAGTILGTFQYMAPEQLEGTEADARTDIFALGVVLYEMTTGRKAFEGKTQASLIASIIGKDPPPVASLQPAVPAALDRVIRVAMAKDPDERWQNARDIVRELKELSQGSVVSAAAGTAATATVPAVRMRRREAAAWTLTSLAIVAAGASGYLQLRGGAANAEVTRFTLTAPPKTEFISNTMLAVSPNGRWIVFMAAAPNTPTELWLRSLDATEATRIAGTENAGVPFWSPDSRYIGFFADGKLKKVSSAGGPPVVLADAPVAGANRGGGTWNADDIIVFQPKNDGPLYRVSGAGGVPVEATRLDASRKEVAHRYPSFLPDDKHFMYVAQPGGFIVVGALDSPETKVLLQADSKPVFAMPGYLLFVRQNVLMAQRFDARRLQLEGDAVPVGQQVRTNPAFGSAAFAASDNGVLAYGSGTASLLSRLEWIDREGRSTVAVETASDYRSVALSPDATKVIVHRHEEPGGGGLWLTDLGRAATSRFTLTATHDANAVWSPDGTRIAFTSIRDQRETIQAKRANGIGDADDILRLPTDTRLSDWSRDGRLIAYNVRGAKSWDVALLPVAPGRTPITIAATDFEEVWPQFSPDGRFIAYNSNESKRYEIYLQSLSPGGGKWQISTAGGIYARWKADGSELYFLGLDQTMMAVAIDLKAATPTIQSPRGLFATRAAVTTGGFPYAVTADGTRFLIASLPEQQAATLTVVLNWHAALPPY
jgi:Tol biopolymer transport system component